MEPQLIGIIAVEVVIALLSIMGNTLVLYVIFRHNALRTKTNYLIGSLAMADLLVGAVAIPCVIINALGIPANFYGCLAMASSITLLTQIAIFNLLAIALERYVAVRFPSKYRQESASHAVILAVIVSWIAGTLVGLVPVFGWNPGWSELDRCSFFKVIDLEYMVYLNFFVCVLVPMIITYSVYGYIFYFIETKLMNRTSTAGSTNAVNHAELNSNDQTPEKKSSSKRMTKEARAAKYIFTIIVAFAVCLIPIHIYNSLKLFVGIDQRYVELACVFMSHANSAINPLIYAHGNRKFRSAMLAFLCRKGQELGSREQALASTADQTPTVHKTPTTSNNNPHLVRVVMKPKPI